MSDTTARRIAPTPSSPEAGRGLPAETSSPPKLSRNEGLDHLARAIGLRPRRRDPLVLGAFEDFVLNVTASSLVRGDELRLRRRQHVVVERPLHDQHGNETNGFMSLADLNRIALVNGGLWPEAACGVR